MSRINIRRMHCWAVISVVLGFHVVGCTGVMDDIEFSDGGAGDGDTDTDTDADMDTDTDSDSDTDADADGDTDSDSDADSDGDTDTDTDTDTDSDSDADSDTDSDGDADSDTDADMDSDSDSDTDSDTDADSDTDSDTDSDGDCPWWVNGSVASWSLIADLPSNIRVFLASPQSDAIVYAAGSGAGVFKSTDYGASWQPSGTGLPGEVVDGLVVCNTDKSELCASVGNSVYASTDDGESWTLRADSVTNSSGGFDGLVSAPTDRQTVYGFAGDTVKRSDNAGIGWVLAQDDLPTDDYIRALAVARDDADVVYAGTGLGFSGRGVFKTVDRGKSWQAANQGMLDDIVEAVYAAGAGVVYASTGDRLLRSGDGAASWVDVTDHLPGGGGGVGFAGHDELLDTLFVLRSMFQVEVSCDGGDSFDTLVAQPTPSISTSFNAPAFTVLHALGEVILLGGTDDDGGVRVVFEYEPDIDTDTGEDTDSDSETDQQDTDTDTGEPPYCSWWESGKVTSWNGIDDLPSHIYTHLAAPTSDATVYASGTGSGVYRSIDYGAHWDASGTGLPGGETVDALVICQETGGIEYCAAAGDAVYASTDDGLNWVLRADNLTSSTGGFTGMVSAPSDPKTLYGFEGDEVFRSDNSGTGWVDASNGLSNSVIVLAVAPDDPDVVYTGTWNQGVFKTVNRGGNWNAANQQMLEAEVKALSADVGGLIYAGAGVQLFESRNGASSWTDISDRLPGAGYYGDVVGFARHEELSDTLFVLRKSFQLEVSCDDGATFRTLVAEPTVPPIQVFSSLPTLRVLKDADKIVLLAGNGGDGDGAVRAVPQ